MIPEESLREFGDSGNDPHVTPQSGISDEGIAQNVIPSGPK